MNEQNFSELQQLSQSAGPEQLIEELINTCRESKDYHHLFDALMLKRKHELGLPLERPASLADVPDEQRKEVEKTYIEAAREVGHLLLEAGDILGAWMYFQVIREPKPVADAIQALPLPDELDDTTEQILNMALFEGIHPEKGVQMMLRLHGTCSTITALDQAFANLSSEDRQRCARVLVRSLYEDLRGTVEREVQQKLAMIHPGESLRSLLTGRDWLFEGGNYHIDVSHLNAVVRFSRSLETAEDLEFALELAEYGARLDPQLQYGGDPPFEDFYVAHQQFFKVLLDQDRQDALQYFRDKLRNEPDEIDKPLLAYVLVDLLMRIEALDEAVDVAAEYLTDLGDEMSFSFAELCRKAGRLNTLQDVMKKKGDPVGFVAALLNK